MITLLASITGFISSIFPELIKLLFDKNDKKHELEILDRQIKMQKLNHKNKLEEISIFADTEEVKTLYSSFKSGINWVDALNGLVRPILAYSFFLLYASVKMVQFSLLEHEALGGLGIYLEVLWTTEDQAIFAGIISFYFGQRAIAKIKGLK